MHFVSKYVHLLFDVLQGRLWNRFYIKQKKACYLWFNMVSHLSTDPSRFNVVSHPATGHAQVNLLKLWHKKSWFDPCDPKWLPVDLLAHEICEKYLADAYTWVIWPYHLICRRSSIFGKNGLLASVTPIDLGWNFRWIIFVECIYNKGRNLLDRLSLFSSIHPFTELKWSFLSIVRWNHNPKLLSQNRIPLPTPRLNVALNSGVRASMVWINIENGERGKSLINTPGWSNTFGPDCLRKMEKKNHLIPVFSL